MTGTVPTSGVEGAGWRASSNQNQKKESPTKSKSCHDQEHRLGEKSGPLWGRESRKTRLYSKKKTLSSYLLRGPLAKKKTAQEGKNGGEESPICGATWFTMTQERRNVGMAWRLVERFEKNLGEKKCLLCQRVKVNGVSTTIPGVAGLQSSENR